MRTFTDSPFERMMQEVPRPARPSMPKAPAGSACRGCSYWRGMACVGICYRELTATMQRGGTSAIGAPTKSQILWGEEEQWNE